MNRPLWLLLGTGTTLGLNFPIGKMAMGAGVNPALWAAVISLGAGLALFLITALFESNGEKPTIFLRFSLVSGFISYVVPNFLTFTVIPKLGSGLAAIMFALSPVITALLSLILRVRPPNRLGVIGIALGLLGALIIITGRGPSFETGGAIWIMAALFIPIFLGVGNVYRTMAWPPGASPRKLASLTNLAAVPFLLAITVLQTRTIDVNPLMSIPGLVILQLAVSTTMFLMFFRLQQIGGPTYLSQIGYVAAAVGLIIGVFAFREIYPLSVWLGAGVVAVGIGFSTLGQARQP